MSTQRTKELSELKKEALAYFSMNQDVPKRIEDALNTLFYDSPHDVFGYLSDYFSKFSKPSFITRIRANKNLVYDSKCQTTFRLNIYCQINNKEKKMLSIDSCCYSPDFINDSAKIQYIQEDDFFRQTKLNDLLEFVNIELNGLVKNYSPLDQDELDEKIKMLFQAKQASTFQVYLFNTKANESTVIKDRTPTTVTNVTPTNAKSKTTPAKQTEKQSIKVQQAAGASSIAVGAISSAAQDEVLNYFQSTFHASFMESTISKAVCLTGACLANKELFEHIADLKQSKISSYKIPKPLITILQNGKGFLGKQQLVKEFILTPKSHKNIEQSIEKISKINRYVRDLLYQSKAQPGAFNKCITDSGCFTCALDTYQQGLDMIENAITTVCGSEDDLSLAVNIGAQEIFDVEKNKYEISLGALKSSDELIELYVEMIAKYPRISIIIEPLSASEPLAWYKLYSRIHKQCLVSNILKVNESSTSAHQIEKSLENLNDDNNKPHDNNEEALNRPPNKVVMPLNFFKFENSTTVTGFNQKIEEMDEKSIFSGLSLGINETDDAFLADLSVANQLSHIKIGGFSRSERVNKINRLIEIEEYLRSKSQLLEEDIKEFGTIEIPDEHSETIKAYLHSIEEKLNKLAAVKK